MTVDTESQTYEKDSVESLKFFGVRHIQVMLVFFLLAIGVGMRVQLSVAIVAMTDNTTSSNPDIPTYDWDNSSVILSSFYWGYLTLQLVAGALGRLYGTKYFLTGAMFFNSTAELLVPVAAQHLGSYGVMACRIFQGMCQGFFYPSVYNLLGSWAPVNERSRLSNFAFTGYSFGSIITSPLVGFMSASSIGWPSTFYLFGILGYAWTILWLFFGASTPSDHKSITKEEKQYIEKSYESQDQEDKLIVPWKQIFTSGPVWTLALANVGLAWSTLTLSTETPTYLSKIMNLDITSNSLLSTASSLVAFFFGFLYAPLSDYLINKKILSRGMTRKLFTGYAALGNALVLIILSFLPKSDNVLSIIMLTATGLFHVAIVGGVSVNQIDLSPRYAGIVMAITNTFSAGIGMTAPLVVQAIVIDQTDKTQWRMVFLITAGLCILSAVIFALFSSGEVQSWNNYAKPTQEKMDSKEDIEIEKIRKISRKMSVIMNM